jgi:hypothetical protein
MRSLSSSSLRVLLASCILSTFLSTPNSQPSKRLMERTPTPDMAYMYVQSLKPRRVMFVNQVSAVFFVSSTRYVINDINLNSTHVYNTENFHCVYLSSPADRMGTLTHTMASASVRQDGVAYTVRFYTGILSTHTRNIPSECDSLVDGDQRRLREGQPCECKDGWGGIDCNGPPHLHRSIPSLTPLQFARTMTRADDTVTCYSGGKTVFNNHQMCHVTSAFSCFTSMPPKINQVKIPDRKIINILPGRPPQVIFSCDSHDRTCVPERMGVLVCLFFIFR